MQAMHRSRRVRGTNYVLRRFFSQVKASFCAGNALWHSDFFLNWQRAKLERFGEIYLCVKFPT